MTTRFFTHEELAVLELLCAGNWDGAEIARAQLPFAQHAGPGHEGDDGCFDISVVGEVPLFPYERHTHVRALLVRHGAEGVGEIELAVDGGLLSAFEYNVYDGDEPVGLPTAADVFEQ